MYHKHRNNTLPTYIQNWPFQANKEIHHHNTRHADELHTHRALHMFAEKCLRYNVIRVVNNSPLCILDKLNTHSLTGFANYAKHIFIQKYQDKCIIQNCYTCLSRNNAKKPGKLLKSIYMSLKHLQYTVLNTQQNMGTRRSTEAGS